MCVCGGGGGAAAVERGGLKDNGRALEAYHNYCWYLRIAAVTDWSNPLEQNCFPRHVHEYRLLDNRFPHGQFSDTVARGHYRSIVTIV